MKANAKIFQAMVLSRNYCDINIKIENNNIEKTDCIKLLGVLIDKDLNFTHQAKHVTVRSSRQVNALGRLRKMLDERSKMILLMHLFYQILTTHCYIIVT